MLTLNVAYNSIKTEWKILLLKWTFLFSNNASKIIIIIIIIINKSY